MDGLKNCICLRTSRCSGYGRKAEMYIISDKYTTTQSEKSYQVTSSVIKVKQLNHMSL